MSLGGGLRVGFILVKVMNLLDGWSFDRGYNGRRFATYVFLTAWSLGGGFLVGVSLVKVVSLLDGWSFDCGYNGRRFVP